MEGVVGTEGWANESTDEFNQTNDQGEQNIPIVPMVEKENSSVNPSNRTNRLFAVVLLGDWYRAQGLYDEALNYLNQVSSYHVLFVLSL